MVDPLIENKGQLVTLTFGKASELSVPVLI